MTAAERFFIACLRDEDNETLSKMQVHWIDTKELKQYRYITDYIRDYGENPPLKDFTDKFGHDKASAPSKPKHYLGELTERYLYTALAERMPGIMSGAKKDVKKAINLIKEMIGDIDVTDHTTKDIRYDSGTTERFDEYMGKKKNNGITYMSTGSEFLDKYWHGYRKADLITIGGRAGAGKCLGFGTEILMDDFILKKVQDVKVGDKLMGPDGKDRNVLSISSGVEQMYWINQVNGIRYRVNESHILSLKVPTIKTIRETIGVRKRKYLGSTTTWETVNISVKEYLQKSDKWKNQVKGYKSYGMEFPALSVPIDPYFLGLWLGDGHSRELCITNIDMPLLGYCADYAETFGGELKRTNDPIVYRMKGCKKLADEFRELKLIKNRFAVVKGDKHIPLSYLKNSREVRLKLLAGIVDSDGSRSGLNSYEITFKNKTLFDGTVQLARSLGLFVSIATKEVKGTIYHRMHISGNTIEIPVLLERKKCTERLQIKDVLHTGVTVEKDTVDIYYGFTIDGDHLFCLSDFTVTHNTWLLILLTLLLEPVVPEEFGDILFVSNEMPEDEIAERFDTVRFRLPYGKFLSGGLNRAEEARYKLGLQRLAKRGSRIVFAYNCNTLEDLESKIHLYKPSIVFVDGSYLMEGKLQEGWEKIVAITRGLKRIAKDTSTPIVNTTQLKRGSGKGTSSKLDGQDEFAYSGSFIQDSDIAIRMFQDKDMIWDGVVGLDHVKGRRLPPELQLIFELNLEVMKLSILEKEEDTVPVAPVVEY